MKLYYSDVLSPRKACSVVRYLNSPVEFIYLDLVKGEQQSPAYLAINPNGKVPTLVDGERIVWEADAVMCHLAERAGSDLWPHDTACQIEVVRWLSWNAQHFYRYGGVLFFQHIIKPRFALGPPDRAEIDEALAGFRRFATVLNRHLAGRQWLVGNGLTVADFSVAVVLPYADEARMPLDEFPAVCRWHDRLCEFDAWRKPFPVKALAPA